MSRDSVKSIVAVALFVAALAALGYRQYQNLLDPADPHAGHWGMADFRDVIYYPIVALLDGNNPYDSQEFMAAYPVGNVFPMYAPHMLLLFLPFGLLPFGVSGVLFWLFMVSTYPVFAFACLKACDLRPHFHRVVFLATGLLVSVPGRWSFDAAQLALLWSVGTLVAMQFAATRPTVAGLGLMLAVCKPTFGVPLAALLLVQGRFRAVCIGTAVSVLASGVVLGVISAGAGWGSVLAVLDQNQSVLEAAQAFHASTSHTRVDANVLLLQVFGLPGGRWTEGLVFASILLVAAVVLRRAATALPASSAGALILLAMTVCVYHQTYDAVLLAPIPLALFAASRRLWSDIPRFVQGIVAAFSAVSLVNVTWTKTFGSLLRRGLGVTDSTLESLASVTAVVNSTACLLAFGLLAIALATAQLRTRRQSRSKMHVDPSTFDRDSGAR